MFVQCLKWQQHGYLGPQSFYSFDGGSPSRHKQYFFILSDASISKFLEEIALIRK